MRRWGLVVVGIGVLGLVGSAAAQDGRHEPPHGDMPQRHPQ